MKEQYYLLSKDTGDGAYLIGLLKRIKKGEYEFTYMIRGDNFPKWFMRIPDMDDIKKTYTTKEVKDKIIHRVVPREDKWTARQMMLQGGITTYDEWVILESLVEAHTKLRKDKYPLSDSHQFFYFYSEIPERVNRYD